MVDFAGGTFTILLNLVPVKEKHDHLVKICDSSDCDLKREITFHFDARGCQMSKMPIGFKMLFLSLAVKMADFWLIKSVK